MSGLKVYQMFEFGWKFSRIETAGIISRLALIAFLVGVTVGSAPSAWAQVITDNFSDGNDTANPTWTHLNNAARSTGQTWDASTGQYHLIAPGNGTIPGLEGYGFVGSYIAGTTFSDVRVTADIVDFPNVGAQGSNFAIAARLNGNNDLPSVGVGFPLHGYSYQYEAAADSGNGEIVLNLLYGDALKDLGSFKLALDNTKDYRFILEAVGNTLRGQVYLLDGSGNPVGGPIANQFRDFDVDPVGNIDHDGDNATPQIPFVPYTSGYSGIYGVGHIFYSDGDFTIDNFKTESLVTTVSADYNGNGIVDAADYVMWRNGDSPDDSQAGYDLRKAHFGLAQGSGSAVGTSVVPEPAAALLILFGLAGLSLGRRR